MLQVANLNYPGLRAHKKSLQRLIVGPWTHSRPGASYAGDAQFTPDAAIDLNAFELRWFDRWLKGVDNGVDREPPVRIYVMGGGDAHKTPEGRVFVGGHWRDAWNTPIEVPVVNLETFDGGLSPQREGGGAQTLTLHFKSAAGRTWVFRSVDKDPAPALDPDTAEGWIGDLTQDMTSTAHPASPLIVAPLLEAVGVEAGLLAADFRISPRALGFDQAER